MAVEKAIWTPSTIYFSFYDPPIHSTIAATTQHCIVGASLALGLGFLRDRKLCNYWIVKNMITKNIQAVWTKW